MSGDNQPSILDQLDAAVPLARFDAFPKLPSTYKARSESRGFFTLFVALIAILLVLNDIGEYIWGWPDYEFSIDTQGQSHLNLNVDMVVNMPCQYLSVDLRDVVGDRLFLSNGFRRDGTRFDTGQATTLKEHAKALSARQAVSQSRNSRGFFSWFHRAEPEFHPTYNYETDGSACRIYGSLQVKKVTANLHVTMLGHGYNSHIHVDHNKMNLSHVITEFSFGPYFPDIAQPLDYSFEIAKDPFMVFQYFLHVVPTTYIAPRSPPLDTNQYSVTHYTRKLDLHEGVPGIFFKFDLDPMVITIHQRTTTLVQFIIRCVGVIGGVFTCATYFVRVAIRAADAVSGADTTPGIVAAEATGVKRKWAGGQLRVRSAAQNSGNVVRQGAGWVVEGSSSPYASYANTPASAGFATQSPYPYSPYLSPPTLSGSASVPPTPGTGVGLGFAGSAFGPPPSGRGHRAGKSVSISRSVSGGLSSPFPPPSPLPSPAVGPPPSAKKDD
ncbi:endoplasmic reticulum vesicle transporter-domain-containing protein [Suillus paluster]|uniref:endoplasmic reticulum vesicle transporter-domain-containing protein n=1 Tax=Suillus paluster TaxID=48578 RepID=UPI001B864F56|nr:endoplasmic reticulum vesicle transporter-domain-containing protein [Suillus paluster]KAG1735355.1 endoplasmic reticulum vesicle transporter-domain-containing protein [Suillus paluster]